MTLLDRRLSIVDKVNEPVGWTGRCALCGSQITHHQIPVFRDSEVYRGKIELAPNTAELGAPVHGPVPRSGSIYAAYPGVRKSEVDEVALSIPKINELSWLAYLGALASDWGK